jgi:hypothetical protein
MNGQLIFVFLTISQTCWGQNIPFKKIDSLISVSKYVLVGTVSEFHRVHEISPERVIYYCNVALDSSIWRCKSQPHYYNAKPNIYYKVPLYDTSFLLIHYEICYSDKDSCPLTKNINDDTSATLFYLKTGHRYVFFLDTAVCGTNVIELIKDNNAILPWEQYYQYVKITAECFEFQEPNYQMTNKMNRKIKKKLRQKNYHGAGKF